MNLFYGFSEFLTWGPLLGTMLGVLAGMILGALPGLTSTMALAILTPLTFGMDTLTAICMLIGVYLGGISGGAISAIAINIPGTPASAATCMDGYSLTKRGEGGKALMVSFVSSMFGGLFSAVILITLAPYIARFGLKFGPPEYFALGMLGLTIIISVSGKDLIKGLVAAVLGFMIATIGIDPLIGYPRFTFESVYLQAGISYVPALIGLFGLAEVISNLTHRNNGGKVHNIMTKVKFRYQEWKDLWGTLIRSSAIGTTIGAIPGAGADIASWASYDIAKRTATSNEKYGEGEIKGVVASEAANNANVGGALIPMMTFGIPGDAQTAILIAALMIQGIAPGPLLFEKSPDLVWPMFAALLVANVLIVVYGLLITKYIVKIISQPAEIIYPLIVLFCIVGAYAVNNSLFDIGIMCLFGFIGFVMKKFHFPVAPLMLALILAPMIETNLRRGLMTLDGNFLMFFTRPLFDLLIVIGIISLVSTLWLRKSQSN